MKCAKCGHGNNEDDRFCSGCGIALASNPEVANADAASRTGASGRYVVFGVGVGLFVLARLMGEYSTPNDAPYLVQILDPLIHFAIWSLILGLIALAIAGALGDVRRRWFAVFGWLFLAAALFEVGMGALNRFVLEPKGNAEHKALIEKSAKHP